MGVMLYLVMGALVFRTLEAPKESSAYEDLLKTKQNFLSNNSCVTEQDFRDLVKVSLHKLTGSLFVFVSFKILSRYDLETHMVDPDLRLRD